MGRINIIDSIKTAPGKLYKSAKDGIKNLKTKWAGRDVNAGQKDPTTEKTKEATRKVQFAEEATRKVHFAETNTVIDISLSEEDKEGVLENLQGAIEEVAEDWKSGEIYFDQKEGTFNGKVSNEKLAQADRIIPLVMELIDKVEEKEVKLTIGNQTFTIPTQSRSEFIFYLQDNLS